MTVLVEKMNVYNTDKSRLSPQELAMASNTIIRQKYNKNFTLEFSRDRKSMSAFVTTASKGPGASGHQHKAKCLSKVPLNQLLNDAHIFELAHKKYP